MTADWAWTLGGIALAAAIFAAATWAAARPPDPLRVRLVNYTLVAMLAMVAGLLGLAHLATLIAGAPVTGRF